ncbi:peptidyl-prolyl cis-trans isomerase-like 3 [Oryzias melastigma]|uniref:peptidyl-prolyl cis-trans isomerase-like 3 n=1 Tax=Oryzias melastigma TaxID=30732 RepID=UPI000CF80B21|nr:peptidyl-prolyl cis-trans isomerase-like 3 [Oryzias melastigma]
MVQTGDPTGTGKGGTSIWGRKFEDEFSEHLKHNVRGVVSMANSGPNSNGSQFFFTYAKQPHLDMKYTIFGKYGTHYSNQINLSLHINTWR